jgi:small subunit ribosomal protein S1
MTKRSQIMAPRLNRERRPKPGNVFTVMPFGIKTLPGGEERDFDELYRVLLVPTYEELGLTPVRADDIYGPHGVLDTVWQGIQEADIVVAVMTGRYPNVMLELGLCLLLGKRYVMITESRDDIPSDLQGERYIAYSNDGPSMLRMQRELKDTITARRSEAANEMMTVPMPVAGSESVPARVISVVRDAVTVEADDGRRAVMGPGDVTWNKLVTDLTKKYRVGQDLNGSFEMDLSGNQRYSLLTTPNPWPDLARIAAPGTVIAGVVHNVVDGLGAFVEVAEGINGMVPHFTIPAHVRLERGVRVNVEVHRLDPDQRRIELRLLDAREGRHPSPPAQDRRPIGVEVGDRLESWVVRAVPEKGFILVKSDELPRPALLHMSRMSDALGSDLLAGLVEEDEIVDVEVVRIDIERNRIEVAEVDPPADEATSDEVDPRLADAA